MTNGMDNKEYRSDLVFDLGFHRGEDTGYYLAMGRQVVAVEANADLIDEGRKRFATELAEGRLTLIHAAIVGSAQRAQQEKLPFFPHPVRSEWGSVDDRWIRRNTEAFGLPHDEPLWVSTCCLEELVDQYGCPSFLKIDIEGADEAVLADVGRLSSVRPNTISWETGKESLKGVLRQHRQLAALGYQRFRVVQQSHLEHTPPVTGADGRQWTFELGCSGLLPELSPLPWRSLTWVCTQYILLFLAFRLVGPRSWFQTAAKHPSPLIGGLPRRIQRWADRRRLPLPGWYDSHAAR